MSDRMPFTSESIGSFNSASPEPMAISQEPSRQPIEIDSPSASPEASAPAGEPCPTPLVWQEVLSTFHSESQPWELINGTHRLVGRTWGEGKPLYLLNSFSATAEMFALTIWLLREEYRCVVFDTFGDRRARGGTRMNGFAADVIAVADHHGDLSLNVFGASFGAAVGLQLALDAPTRVSRLTLQHGFARRRLSIAECLLSAWYWRSRRSLAQFPGRRRIQELNHRRWFPPFDGTRFEFLVNSTGSIPLSDLAEKALAVNSFNVTNRLHELSCPVMLLRTEGEGRLEQESHAGLEQGLKHAKTEWMHSSGLHPALTHPHRLAKLLKSFFAAEPA